MTQAQTAGGDLDGTEPGRTLIYGHVVKLDADVQTDHPERWGGEDERAAVTTASTMTVRHLGVLDGKVLKPLLRDTSRWAAPLR